MPVPSICPGEVTNLRLSTKQIILSEEIISVKVAFVYV